MADDVELPGDGSVVAADEVGGVYYQRIKVDLGADGATSPLVRGQQTAALSLPVVIASDQPSIPVTASIASLPLPTGGATEATLATRLSESDFDGKTGALTETAPATDTASSGLNGRLQRIAQRLTSLIALLPTALGSAAASASLAVTQSTEDVARMGAVGETAPATDTASSGLNGRLQRVAQRLTSIIALLPAALGSGGGLKVDGSGTALPVSAASLPLPSGAATSALQSSTETLVGAVTETAPATDTASSGLNGRLQRIAQRITSLIALVPAALTGSGNFKVAVQEAIPAGTNNIGDVDVLSVPADPYGANADAASASGSISAKLRGIATALGITALDLGSGTGGSRTLRFFKDTAQWIGGAGAVTSAVQRVTLASDDPAVAALQILDNVTQVTVSTDVTRPANTTAYAINDAWADSDSAPTAGGFTFTSAARASGGSGIITDAIITNSGGPAIQLQGEIWIFDTAPTAINDNAAFAVSDAEAKTIVAKIPFACEDIGNQGFYHAQNLAIGFTTVGSANLRFLIRVKNAYAPAANSDVLTARLKIIQTT